MSLGWQSRVDSSGAWVRIGFPQSVNTRLGPARGRAAHQFPAARTLSMLVVRVS